MKYEELLPISHEHLEQALAGEAPEEAARALLRMALNDRDRQWAERKCLAALRDSREEVRPAAITSLGHLARIHRVITNEAAVQELRKLQDDPKLGGLAEAALEEILLFTSVSSSPS